MEEKIKDCVTALKECKAECDSPGCKAVGAIPPAVLTLILSSALQILQAILAARKEPTA